jgi:transposase-like protein
MASVCGLLLSGIFPGKFPGVFPAGRAFGSFSFLLPIAHERSDLMTFVSVAEAARSLGIDEKTLRRWLADAQLPLQSHPHDGRKKGISQEHLQDLARLHQRSLASPPEVPSAPISGEEPSLPDSLLALPEQIAALQTQIAALQQQVADLTLLLQQQAAPKAEAAAPIQPGKTSQRSPKPAPQASLSRPAAKTPRKSAHVIPRVEYGEQGRYVVICPKKGRLALEPDSEEWFAWVKEQESFRFVGKGGYFTAHHWWRVPHGAWRAHRKIRNHTRTLRLAPNQELTIAVLEQAAEALQALCA